MLYSHTSFEDWIVLNILLNRKTTETKQKQMKKFKP